MRNISAGGLRMRFVGAEASIGEKWDLAVAKESQLETNFKI
jgi:hypothetical protein